MHLITAQEVAGLNPAEVTDKQRAHVKWAFLFIPISHKTLTKQPIFKIKKMFFIDEKIFCRIQARNFYKLLPKTKKTPHKRGKHKPTMKKRIT